MMTKSIWEGILASETWSLCSLPLLFAAREMIFGQRACGHLSGWEGPSEVMEPNPHPQHH